MLFMPVPSVSASVFCSAAAHIQFLLIMITDYLSIGSFVSLSSISAVPNTSDQIYSL